MAGQVTDEDFKRKADELQREETIMVYVHSQAERNATASACLWHSQISAALLPP